MDWEELSIVQALPVTDSVFRRQDLVSQLREAESRYAALEGLVQQATEERNHSVAVLQQRLEQAECDMAAKEERCQMIETQQEQERYQLEQEWALRFRQSESELRNLQSEYLLYWQRAESEVARLRARQQNLPSRVVNLVVGANACLRTTGSAILRAVLQAWAHLKPSNAPSPCLLPCAAPLGSQMCREPCNAWQRPQQKMVLQRALDAAGKAGRVVAEVFAAWAAQSDRIHVELQPLSRVARPAECSRASNAARAQKAAVACDVASRDVGSAFEKPGTLLLTTVLSTWSATVKRWRKRRSIVRGGRPVF